MKKILMIDPQLTVGRINLISSKMNGVFVRLKELNVEVQSQKFWLNRDPSTLDKFEKAEKGFFTTVANNITNETIIIIRFVNTSLERAIRLVHFLREKRPNVTILYGGSAATLLSNQIPALNPLYLAPVDALIIGEADITLPEYVQKRKKVAGIKNLIDPFTPRSYLYLGKLSPLSFNLLQRSVGNYPILPLSEVKVEVAASRGCPRKCYFCEMSAMMRWLQVENGCRAYRLRDVNSVVDDLNHLYECGVRKIFFSDLIFPWQKKWIDSLKETEVVNKFREVGIYTSPDRLKPEYLEQLASLRVTKISIGVETATDRLFKRIGKPKVLLKELELNLEKTKTFGIDVRLAWVLGFPTETLPELKTSINQAITWSNMGLVKEHDFHNFHPRLDQIGQREYSHLGREYMLQNGRYDFPIGVLPEAIQKYDFQWKWGYYLEHFVQQIAPLKLSLPLARYGASEITIQELVDSVKMAMERTRSGLTDPW